MKNAAQIEQAVLSLPPAERAHLALAAWDSLEADPAFASDRVFDSEGVAAAAERDNELVSGRAKPLTHGEFRRRTGKREA